VSDLNKKSEFEELLGRNRGRLSAISRSYARSDADDLLQEILLQIWRGMDRFERRSSIDTWCYRVALNTAISWQKTAGRRKLRVRPGDSDVDQIAGGDDGRDGTELLRQFLQTLSDTDRALTLMYLDDMSGNEMAEVTGISAGALRVRIHRIKCRLAEWKVGDT
jgi:RNA polymerase sigma-70 factor (ECF subfamily)